jgi:hypothetical protein
MTYKRVSMLVAFFAAIGTNLVEALFALAR